MKDLVLTCTFCGKAQQTVEKLIAGPGVYICNECIRLCNEIIIEEMPPTEDETAARLTSIYALVNASGGTAAHEHVAELLGVSTGQVAELETMVRERVREMKSE